MEEPQLLLHCQRGAGDPQPLQRRTQGLGACQALPPAAPPPSVNLLLPPSPPPFSLEEPVIDLGPSLKDAAL